MRGLSFHGEEQQSVGHPAVHGSTIDRGSCDRRSVAGPAGRIIIARESTVHERYGILVP
jgi:hypothetical protein